MKSLMKFISERLRLIKDLRKLRKKSYKYADIFAKEFKKGKCTKEHMDNFYDSLRDIDNYRKQRIRQFKLINIKIKINNNEKNKKQNSPSIFRNKRFGV